MCCLVIGEDCVINLALSETDIPVLWTAVRTSCSDNECIVDGVCCHHVHPWLLCGRREGTTISKFHLPHHIIIIITSININFVPKQKTSVLPSRIVTFWRAFSLFLLSQRDERSNPTTTFPWSFSFNALRCFRFNPQQAISCPQVFSSPSFYFATHRVYVFYVALGWTPNNLCCWYSGSK